MRSRCSRLARDTSKKLLHRVFTPAVAGIVKNKSCSRCKEARLYDMWVSYYRDELFMLSFLVFFTAVVLAIVQTDVERKAAHASKKDE